MNEQKYPEVACGALIFNQEGKIFLIVTPKWHGKYGLPGGHVEIGEKLEDTVKREVKEETNLDVFDIKFLMMQECIFDEGFYRKKHFIFLDYFCQTKHTDVILDGREATEYVWVTIEEALKLDLVLYTRNAILDYRRKHLSN